MIVVAVESVSFELYMPTLGDLSVLGGEKRRLAVLGLEFGVDNVVAAFSLDLALWGRR